MNNQTACDIILTQIEDLTQDQLVRMQIPKEIADHVRSCSSCKAHLDQYLSLATHTQTWQVPEPGKHIGTGVMAQIAQLEHDKSASQRSPWQNCLALIRTRIQIPASIAAMILVLLSVSITLNVTQLRQGQAIVKQSPIPQAMTPQHTLPVAQQIPASYITPKDFQSITPWLGQTQIPVSTMVIILGAPPLSWTDTPSEPVSKPHAL